MLAGNIVKILIKSKHNRSDRGRPVEPSCLGDGSSLGNGDSLWPFSPVLMALLRLSDCETFLGGAAESRPSSWADKSFSMAMKLAQQLQHL